MDGLIFFLIFVFVIIPIFKNFFTGPNNTKNVRRKSAPPPQKNPWGEVQTELKNRLQDLQSQNGKTRQHSSPEAAIKRKRDTKDNSQTPANNVDADGRNVMAMRRVSNKSRTDWGTRGDRGFTSGKAVFSAALVLAAIYIVIFGTQA